jgi:SAM-dependent methyltransferase
MPYLIGRDGRFKPSGNNRLMSEDATWLDSMPQLYDHYLSGAIFEPYADYLAHRLGDLAPQSLLEVAAGTGVLTRQLARALPGTAITATDLNPAMVSFGADRVPGAHWQVADAQQLPFDDGSFDAVVCQFGVMFFPDRPGAFAEGARVLRPGGSYVFATWDRIEFSELPAQVEAAVARALPDHRPDFMSRIPHGYADPDQIRRDVVAGGLEVTGFDRIVLHGRPVSPPDLGRGFCLGSPLRFQLAESGDPAEIAERVAADLHERLGDAAVEGELAAFVVAARKAG